jgi:hypothetical protein
MALRTQVEQMQVCLQSLREERERDVTDFGATVRRMDNERQNLKLQLVSEITHKNELQAVLEHHETRARWASDVYALKDFKKDTRSGHNQESQMEQQLLPDLEQRKEELAWIHLAELEHICSDLAGTAHRQPQQTDQAEQQNETSVQLQAPNLRLLIPFQFTIGVDEGSNANETPGASTGPGPKGTGDESACNREPTETSSPNIVSF